MKKVLLLCFLLGLSWQAMAQSPLYEDTEKPKFPVKYGSSSFTTDHGFTDHFLDKIAKGMGKGSSLAEFSIGFQQYVKIFKNQAGQFEGNVFLHDFFYEGDYTFKGFPLGDVLIPSKMDLAVDVLRNNNPFKSFAYTDVRTTETDKKPLQFNFNDTVPNASYSVKVKDVKFRYTNGDQNRFDQRISDIESFFGFQKDFHLALLDLQRIQPSDAEHIFDQDAALRKIEDLIGRFQSMNFPDRLNMPPAELSKFGFAFEQVFTLAGRLRQDIDATIASLDQYYYSRGTELLVNGHEPEALGYFNKSLQRNPTYSPAIYQLAKIDFQNGGIDAAAQKVTDILTRFNPDGEYRNLSIDLGNRIYDAYLQQGNNMLAAKSWTKAIDAFLQGDGFARRTTGLVADSRTTEGIAKARNGIYQDYLAQARKFLQKNDYNGAEAIIKDGMNYAAQYPAAITNTADAGTLMLAAKQGQYKNAIAAGAKLLKTKSYQDAFAQLQNAEGIQQQYGVKKDAALADLLKTAARPLVLAYLQQARNLVADPQAAAAKAKPAKEWIARYGLSTDKEVQALNGQFDKELLAKLCAIQKTDYLAYLNKGDQAAANKDFIQATENYTQAVMLKGRQTECGLDTREAEQKRSAIAQATDYQRMLGQTAQLVYNGEYDKALQAYIDAANFYTDNHLGAYVPAHQPLFDYIRGANNPAFSLAGAQYMASAGKGQQAVDLVKAAMNQGYTRKDTKRVQQQIASVVATADARGNSDKTVYKQKTAAYTMGDKNLKYFVKAYKKQWKKLT